ncbi:MAG: death-on-curing family protein [Candidatus Woesebacteria bacterium GW2011_GWA1_33_30]|uniref:Death-on-curing family protein n=1 Tax=Candidatus Woesebacteria bacterium GW2011_GWA2_33_28 TaxID=1618561 RepID=A0A0F9ZSN2_9BACT|nr:MAG: death-on-curing family protein [Candidatus Woesebacteria bacterium GW2011_GWA2_33_28]KKP48175.1 MAG: death-on-curing family protein [Candidatus Woesebacteria bacterium GW2011_GWA1_33_30]KKP49417.1 MAG: prophage maintenance system killer protein, death on curing protein [Microgenomates group bacterium GW2011_GWC1_33_32]KKP52143.1 MAG: death-on-curing family protein [Candidatus Woesebacteria bacterium GW2011_GWB1_33_38]
MNLHKLDISEVYAIHEAIIKRAKTKASIRDFSLLHSAVERPYTTFEGQDLYQTIFLKAGALIQSICLNHAFSDGNKRTAWIATKRFLWINGYHLKSEAKEAVDFMIWIDNSHSELKKISNWLKNHSKKV